jgi:hypothetical protein
MLRVHFLNVGHGDCTLIQHHGGRLTMVDINTSQEYDPDSFKELLADFASPTSLRRGRKVNDASGGADGKSQERRLVRCVTITQNSATLRLRRQD